MKKAFCVLVAASLCAPSVVQAQSIGAPRQAQPVEMACAAGAAHLSARGASVLVSRGGSFAEATDGAALSVGDRVLVREGSASIVVGQKVVTQAAAGSMMKLVAKDGAICAAQATLDPAVVAQRAPQTNFAPPPPPPEHPLWVAGGVVVAGAGLGIGLAVHNGKHGLECGVACMPFLSH